MINQKAIDEFLGRKLNSYDWVKRETLPDLKAEIAAMQPMPDFGDVKPWQHQLACFLIFNELRRFIYFIDMGGGKTNLVLMSIHYRKQCGDRIKAIVFVPFITAISTWLDQVAEHFPNLKCVPLMGSTGENLAALNQQADLFVICYQSAVAMVTEKGVLKKGKRKGKSGWQLTAADVRRHFTDFNFLVLDELHKSKNVSSLTYRMCRAISSQCEWVIGLTGTPFGRDLRDLWPQFYLIDFGETLGDTLGLYEQAFYRQTKGWFTKYEYKFKQSLLPNLRQMIKNRSISYGIDELVDMPPRQFMKLRLQPPDTGRGYCEAASKALREAQRKGDYAEIESNYLKLRQLSSGFMTLRGEDTSKLQVAFEDNPKLDALESLLDTVPYGCKMVVFHHFIYTNQLISERLKKLKIKHARIWSGQRDPLGQLRMFKEELDCTVMVINSRSGSSALNLQHANYVAFFESPDNPIDRQQAEARCWRPGQAKRVFYYDFIVRGTVDEQLWAANKAGENLLKQLLRGKA